MEPVIFDISPLSDDETAGPVESHDIYLYGRGISLLINVPAGSTVTYSVGVDGHTHRYRGAIRDNEIVCHEETHEQS